MGALGNTVMAGGGALGNSYDSTSSLGSGGSSGPLGGAGGRGPGRGQAGNRYGAQNQGRGHAQQAFNPYLNAGMGAGAGQQGASQQHGRGSGTAHFNPQVERRPHDRSLIYSSNNQGPQSR
jgi:hypothetical protein